MKKKIIVFLTIFMISTLFASPTALKPDKLTVAVETMLIYGTINIYDDLDPHETRDSDTIDLINQVAEGLFAYNLGSSDGEIVPRLAASCGEWNENATELTIPLRENATFHDGTAFNASAVKWNFDRLTAFIEAGKTEIDYLYEPLAGVYPATPLVINRTEVEDEFTVKFILNYPFLALIPLLCFSGSVIISPSSVTNSSEFLDIDTDLLVGTGPFVHVNSTSEKIVFAAYSEYYRGTSAIQHMEWVKFDFSTMVSTALLNGAIDIGDIDTDFMAEFEVSPDITVGQPMKRTDFMYMGMNNKLIGRDLRQAISYAIDYDYVIEEITDGNATRAISPVPEGIAYHNPNVLPATYNVTKARQILIDAGLSKGLTAISPDQDWLSLATSDPIASYNFTYHFRGIIGPSQVLGNIVSTNCQAIGINVTLTGVVLSAFLESLSHDFDNLNLYMLGWAPDYNDPSNLINPLFSNTSAWNSDQVNDPWLQDAMMTALEDTNQITRKETYYAIQEYIVEDLMPIVFLYVPIVQNVLRDSITNWKTNPMRQLDFFSITFHGEEAILEDPQMSINCGFEAPWDYYIHPEDNGTNTTDDPTEDPTPSNPISDIPGYSLVALICMTVLTLTTVGYKQRKKVA